jgi:ribosomal-protein-alanine N-acetyltransferase
MDTQDGQNEISIVKMEFSHLPQIMEIEKKSFSDPWSRKSFIREITQNHYAHYFVACQEDQVIGYIGGWNVVDELHITNLAVDPAYRRVGVARKLIDKIINEVKEEGVVKATLEVRVSNKPAISLYEKCGFIAVGKRPRYYINNGEDALIMWKEIADG